MRKSASTSKRDWTPTSHQLHWIALGRAAPDDIIDPTGSEVADLVLINVLVITILPQCD